MQRRTVKIGKLEIGANNPIVFITGPCQLESRDHAMMMAEHIAEISSRTGSKFIFKSSYDKANRSSISSTRGIGMQEGLRILQDISKTFDCPVITDIHEASQCDVAAQAVDVLQIPAFLCRQTDLLILENRSMLKKVSCSHRGTCGTFLKKLPALEMQTLCFANGEQASVTTRWSMISAVSK